MKKSYLVLVFITLLSVYITTKIIFNGMEPLLHSVIVPYDNCYYLLQDINNLDSKLSKILLFYILFFIIYFILFSFILLKILKWNKMQNKYITITILMLFNAILMGFVIYTNFTTKKNLKWWCDNTKEVCYTSYKIIHKLDSNSTYTPSLEDIKPYFLDTIPYLEKAKRIPIQ